MRPLVTVYMLAFAVTFAGGPAMASGTSGGGYGGGGSYPSTPRDPAAEAYSRGQSMVKKRIACKKCAFPAGVQDTPTAKAVASRVRSGEFDLKSADREQVLYYLSRRFGA